MSDRVYLAGPMKDHVLLNEAAFRTAEGKLRARGYDVVVPHDVPPWDHGDDPCPQGGYFSALDSPHPAACYLRRDMMELLTCDEVYVLKGWENSIGARLEMQVAATCGIPVTFVDEFGDPLA